MSAWLPLPVQVCYNLGCVGLAKKTTRQALSLLKKRFPQTCSGAFVMSLWERFQGGGHWWPSGDYEVIRFKIHGYRRKTATKLRP